MSKLIDQLRSTCLGDRRAILDTPFVSYTEYSVPPAPSSFDYHTKYSIAVSFGTEVWAQPEQLPSIKKTVVSALEDSIFGEFKRDLIHAILYAKQGDAAEALVCIERVYDAMYTG